MKFYLLILTLGTLCLVSCGQSGELFLPNHPPDSGYYSHHPFYPVKVTEEQEAKQEGK